MKNLIPFILIVTVSFAASCSKSSESNFTYTKHGDYGVILNTSTGDLYYIRTARVPKKIIKVSLQNGTVERYELEDQDIENVPNTSPPAPITEEAAPVIEVPIEEQ